MSSIIVFAGTTEGRTLSEWLCDNRIPHTVCVATEYGEQVLKEHPLANVLMGRMDEAKMETFFEEQGASIVVDATHPYAYVVTENIKKAAAAKNVKYLRLLREGMDASNGADASDGRIVSEEEAAKPNNEVQVFPDTHACAKYLLTTDGTIFLTTGSKELSVFCQQEALKSRLIARVLPGSESIGICEREGLPGKQIVAMQGPFSVEMNVALLKNYHAKILVTKASGKAGGFAEKLEAAKNLGIKVCVIGRPVVENGYSFAEICEFFESYVGVDSGFSISAIKQNSSKDIYNFSLIGCGMGHPECLTLEASEALKKADLVFGAKRLLKDMEITKECYPWYLAKDIIPFIKNRMHERRGSSNIAILFSGDTGFYSGAKKMIQALREAFTVRLTANAKATIKGFGKDNQVEAPTESLGKDNHVEINAEGVQVNIEIYPGISSIVNLAAMLGESWEDAKILSIHGQGTPDQWGRKVLKTIKEEKKTFLLLSGVRDLQTLGTMITEEMSASENASEERSTSEDQKLHIYAGYQMSYPEQEILELSAKDCMERTKEGLYSLLILNDHPKKCVITHGLSDDAFLRSKVPMTKEEVRTISISKLHLTEDSVVYDVGSGTGSVAVEIARLSPDITVYAIERKPEALDLIRQNKEKFGLNNLVVVPGLAPEALEDLPVPTHVFIGGSGGHMMEILASTFAKNPAARVVANAVSFETLQELLKIEENFKIQGFDLIQLSATRTRTLGNYHMTQGENPVWICAFQGAG